LDRSSIAEAARRLRVAAATGKQCAPVRHLLGSDTDIEAAYAVQQANVALAVAGGRRASGHKIDLASPAVQEQLGFGQPVSGVLFADTCVPDGLDIPAGTAVRFEPGEGKTVSLVPIAGARVVRGGNAWASGLVDETRDLEMPE